MIERGQIYRAVRPAPSMSGVRHRRIKVVGNPMSIPGVYGFGSVSIVTLEEGGGEVRMRSIKVDQLHFSALTADGQPRRNGYVLEGPNRE